MNELIEKYFSDELNLSERLNLSKLLKDKENSILFKEYVRVHYDLNIALQNVNLEELYLELIKGTKQKKKAKRTFYKGWYKWAAIFIGVFGLSYYYLISTNTSQNIIDKNAIILTLENGENKVILENGSEKIINDKGVVVGSQEGTKLDYKSIHKATNNGKEKKLSYNELTVPYGKKFEIVLSDGTKVKLNAGTSVKYPVKFIKGENRHVFLNGEAYFDVIKDEAHPFIVSTNEINVRVLGTQFNISSYPEDKNINTILVEGSVSIYKKGVAFNLEKSSVLEPGQRGAWNKVRQDVSIEKVDTTLYTGWVDGKIVFDHLPFEDIIKKLERHYAVSIISHNKKLNKEKFTASFDIETIEQVLNSFNKNYPLNFKFNTEKNQIIIN